MPKEYFGEGLDQEVEAAIRAAFADLEESLGAELLEVSLPHTEYAWHLLRGGGGRSLLQPGPLRRVKYGIRAEGRNLMRPTSTPDSRFGAEVRRRIM